MSFAQWQCRLRDHPSERFQKLVDLRGFYKISEMELGTYGENRVKVSY